jgi:hypothetical protein
LFAPNLRLVSNMLLTLLSSLLLLLLLLLRCHHLAI